MVILLIAGGGILTPITTTQIETNRPGKFGKSIYTNDSTYFTYNLTEALGTSDFTLSYWAKIYDLPVFSVPSRNMTGKSISIGAVDKNKGESEWVTEYNTSVYEALLSMSYYSTFTRIFYSQRYCGDETGVSRTYFVSSGCTEQWHHFAIIRYGKYLLTFIDGKITGWGSNFWRGITMDENERFNQTTIYIGDSPSGQWLEQDVDDICLIKGEALFINKDNFIDDFSVPNTYLDVSPFIVIETKKIFYNFRVDI